jgi:ubiquinone/menaquinone biosynthesis C-methylase UbiE
MGRSHTEHGIFPTSMQEIRAQSGWLDRSEDDPMDHREVGQHWNKIASTWTAMARAGYDFYRDHFNTPAFMDFLPDVRGLQGLDIGCGEGYNTRLLAGRGAVMAAIDISEVFVHHAAEIPPERHMIDYGVASAVRLPFSEITFDFATGFMSFMDIPEIEDVLMEIARVLRPSGFVQFSISHPCFDTAHRVNLRNREGLTFAIEVGDYFRNLNGEMVEFNKPASQAAKDGFPLMRIPRFTRTISQWINALLDAGLIIERVNEPRPTDEQVQECPGLQDAQVVSYFLHIRARKPAVSQSG